MENSELQPDIYGQNPQKNMSYDEIETDLNARIMEITQEIRDNYPELIKYLDEMPVTIPDEDDPEINVRNLQSYYDSLQSVVDKYAEEQSDKTPNP